MTGGAMGTGRGPRRDRRSERGATLLPALGITTILVLGTTASLSLVAGESEAQRAVRLQRQAAFAAEAGLAEGRERLKLLAAGADRYTAALAALPVASDHGNPAAGDPWYDLLRDGTEPWVTYPLLRGASGPVALLDAELPPGVALPSNAGVRYRVFVRDDHDVDGAGGTTPSDQTRDANGRVWLVGVGEVLLPSGRPVRVVMQQLVSNQGAQADAVSEAYGQKGVTASKGFRAAGTGVGIDLAQQQSL